MVSHGALAVVDGRAREQRQHLQAALAANRENGVPVGILMATRRLNREEALAPLRGASQYRNRKLDQLAGEMIGTGQLALPPRLPRRLPQPEGIELDGRHANRRR